MDSKTILKITYNVIEFQLSELKEFACLGMTPKIREESEKEYSKLKKVKFKSIEDIIKDKDIILPCFSNFSIKLSDNSRNLPSYNLRQIADQELKTLHDVWKFIEQNND